MNPHATPDSREIWSVFRGKLLDHLEAHDPELRAEIEKDIWARFGVEGAVLIMDMSGFSLMTRRHGIVYYLARIQRMQQISQPIIEAYGGDVVKYEADNCFAWFPKVEQSIRAAIEINREIRRVSLQKDAEYNVKVSCGIDYGKFLVVDDSDFFGDAVNQASKLGEDIASPEEILVSQRAIEQIPEGQALEWKQEPVEFSISGLKLTACRILYPIGD